MRLVWSWCTWGTDGGFAQKQLISDRLASPSASPTPTRLLKRSRRDVRWKKNLINSLYRVFLKSPVIVFLGICRSGGFFRHCKWLNKCILPMVPLTDNIVFGRKIAFLREMAAAVGSSLPWTRRKLATFSTSDSSKSSQQRRGTVKVTPKLRSPRPSPSGKCGGKCGGSLLPHQRGHPKAKTFKKTEDSGGASLHPIRQTVQTSPSSTSAGMREKKKKNIIWWQAPNHVFHHWGINPSETEPQLCSSWWKLIIYAARPSSRSNRKTENATLFFFLPRNAPCRVRTGLRPDQTFDGFQKKKRRHIC